MRCNEDYNALAPFVGFVVGAESLLTVGLEGQCTLAVIAARAFAPRGLPEMSAFERGPFRTLASSDWLSILDHASR